MSEALKPCPFCCGEALTVCSEHDWWHVECHDCCTRSGKYGTREYAIKEWNTRAERTCYRKKHLNLTIGDNFLTQSGWDCSECGGRLDLPVKAFYCPHCGAKVVEQ